LFFPPNVVFVNFDRLPFQAFLRFAFPKSFHQIMAAPSAEAPFSTHSGPYDPCLSVPPVEVFGIDVSVHVFSSAWQVGVFLFPSAPYDAPLHFPPRPFPMSSSCQGQFFRFLQLLRYASLCLSPRFPSRPPTKAVSFWPTLWAQSLVPAFPPPVHELYLCFLNCKICLPRLLFLFKIRTFCFLRAPKCR